MTVRAAVVDAVVATTTAPEALEKEKGERRAPTQEGKDSEKASGRETRAVMPTAVRARAKGDPWIFLQETRMTE